MNTRMKILATENVTRIFNQSGIECGMTSGIRCGKDSGMCSDFIPR